MNNNPGGWLDGSPTVEIYTLNYTDIDVEEAEMPSPIVVSSELL